MAVTYDVAVKTARLNATRTFFLDGTLKIRNAAEAVLATFVLSATAGSVTTDVWTLAFVASTVAAGASGTADHAIMESSLPAAGITGLTVGLSGADINLDNLSINNLQNITISSAAITHAT